MDRTARLFIHPNCVDGVLMDRLQLCVRVSLSLEIHLAEHIEGRLVPHTASSGSRLALDSTCQLPPALITAEAEWLAILETVSTIDSALLQCSLETHMTRGNNLVFPVPNQASKRQEACGDVQHGPRRLFGGTGVNNSDTAVVTSES